MMNALVGAVDSFASRLLSSGLPVYVAASRLAPFTRTASGDWVNRPYLVL
jgi:hypothetical protein